MVNEFKKSEHFRISDNLKKVQRSNKIRNPNIIKQIDIFQDLEISRYSTQITKMNCKPSEQKMHQGKIRLTLLNAGKCICLLW